MTNPIIVFVGGTLTMEDGHRVDSRQSMDPVTESVVRKALLRCPTWWEVVKSLVVPIAVECGWGVVAHTYETLWRREPSGNIKLVKRGDLYSGPAPKDSTIEISGDLVNLTYTKLRGFNTSKGSLMLVLPDTAWLRSQVFKRSPQPDPVHWENAELYRDPLREYRLVPIITDFRVTALVKGAQWTDPESLEAARLKVLNGSRIPLWTLYTSALCQALTPVEFPILEGEGKVSPRALADVKRKADAIPQLHEELSRANWRAASFINYLTCCTDGCGCKGLDVSSYMVEAPEPEAFAGNRDFQSIHHPKIELEIQGHSVSAVVKNYHWTTFDVNQWVDDHIAYWDEVSIVPRWREMTITPHQAFASRRYRKPWDVQYQPGRSINDHRRVCIWRLEKGWMDPDIDWRAIGRELAACTGGWLSLMESMVQAFGIESKWRDAKNDNSVYDHKRKLWTMPDGTIPLGDYSLPGGRVITFTPLPEKAKLRKRKRSRAA